VGQKTKKEIERNKNEDEKKENATISVRNNKKRDKTPADPVPACNIEEG
jgi:hypothetical protein